MTIVNSLQEKFALTALRFIKKMIRNLISTISRMKKAFKWRSMNLKILGSMVLKRFFI